VRTIVKGKNMDVPESVRSLRRPEDATTGALPRRPHRRDPSSSPSNATERRRLAIAELTLVIDGQALHGRAEAATYEAAIDEVVDKGERRAVDHREKPRVRARAPEEKGILARIADGTAEPVASDGW